VEIIKRKILLEDLISRVPGVTYNTITASTICINVFLTQTMDDMGMFTDIDYVETSSGKTVDDYFTFNNTVTGFTDSKLTLVKSYNRETPYDINKIINSEQYLNYNNTIIDGVSKVIDLSGPTGYTIDTINDINIGTVNQSSGILYNDYNNFTTMQYIGEGWNNTNISLSGLTKDEILFGIISPPEVKSDIFIERGVTTVLEPHLKLCEIESVEHLENYGNGYYNLIK